MMHKLLLLAALLSGAAGAQGFDAERKSAIDATWTMADEFDASAPLAPLDGPPFGDMDPDPAFGNNGIAYYTPDPGAPTENWGVKMFARPDQAGWYLLGRHRTGTNPWWAVVMVLRADGVAERTITVPTPMFRLDDATWDSVNGRFYFVGGARQPGLADSDFAVTCVDINNGPDGGVCSDFGTGGTAFIAFDRGGNMDDVARRVISRPNLGVLVAGWARDGADRYVFAATSLLRQSGGLVTRFGTNGRFTTDLGSIRPNLDVNVFDIALSDDADSEARLYIAGNYSRDEARNNYDGVVLGLNAWNGVFDDWGPGGNGFTQVWLDLGIAGGDMSDAVTAITPLSNGKLALAGWSKDQAGLNRMMLARLRENGQLDINSGFCINAGKCTPFNSGRSFWPTAIRERPDTRDLVIAAENPNHPGVNDETWQMLFRFDRNGSYLQAATQHSPHDSTYEYTVPAALLVDRGSTTIVGTRRWNAGANDYDMRVTRLLHNDTVFADDFGGPRAN